MVRSVFPRIDQTTRIHAEVSSGEGAALKAWHEIARPQVHGYDLLDAAFIDSFKFISIADEKVARVFEAPREFVETVRNLRVIDVVTDPVSAFPPSFEDCITHFRLFCSPTGLVPPRFPLWVCRIRP